VLCVPCIHRGKDVACAPGSTRRQLGTCTGRSLAPQKGILKSTIRTGIATTAKASQTRPHHHRILAPEAGRDSNARSVHSAQVPAGHPPPLYNTHAPRIIRTSTCTTRSPRTPMYAPIHPVPHPSIYRPTDAALIQHDVTHPPSIQSLPAPSLKCNNPLFIFAHPCLPSIPYVRPPRFSLYTHFWSFSPPAARFTEETCCCCPVPAGRRCGARDRRGRDCSCRC